MLLLNIINLIGNIMKKFAKYQKNLYITDEFVYSYNTKVAKIVPPFLIVNKYYSKTKTKHINYIAKQLNYQIKQNEL